MSGSCCCCCGCRDVAWLPTTVDSALICREEWATEWRERVGGRTTRREVVRVERHTHTSWTHEDAYEQNITQAHAHARTHTRAHTHKRTHAHTRCGNPQLFFLPPFSAPYLRRSQLPCLHSSRLLCVSVSWAGRRETQQLQRLSRGMTTMGHASVPEVRKEEVGQGDDWIYAA